MDIKEFISNFADQFDDMDANALTPETDFKQLEGWNSLVALSVIAMVDEEFDVTIKGSDIRYSKTIADLYNTIVSKQ